MLIKNLGNAMPWSSCRCTCHHTALSESLALTIYLLRRISCLTSKLKGANETTKYFSSCNFGIVQQDQWCPAFTDLSCNKPVTVHRKSVTVHRKNHRTLTVPVTVICERDGTRRLARSLYYSIDRLPWVLWIRQPADSPVSQRRSHLSSDFDIYL